MAKTGYLYARVGETMESRVNAAAAQADVSASEWIRWALQSVLESGAKYRFYGSPPVIAAAGSPAVDTPSFDPRLVEGVSVGIPENGGSNGLTGAAYVKRQRKWDRWTGDCDPQVVQEEMTSFLESEGRRKPAGFDRWPQPWRENWFLRDKMPEAKK